MPPRVLIVDDDPHAHFFAKRALSRGANVGQFCEAWDGREAIEVLTNHAVDTQNRITHVVLDLQMPIMDGFEFLEAFDKLPSNCTEGVRVVLVSSSPNLDHHDRVRQHNCVRAIFSKQLSKADASAVLYDVD